MAMKTTIYTPTAQAKGAARQWVRNVDIWVLLYNDGRDYPTNIRSPYIQQRHYLGRADSRYTGPKSFYSQLMNKAKEIKQRLDTDWQ